MALTTATLNDYFMNNVIHGKYAQGTPEYNKLFDSWWGLEADRQGVRKAMDVDIGKIVPGNVAAFQQSAGPMLNQSGAATAAPTVPNAVGLPSSTGPGFSGLTAGVPDVTNAQATSPNLANQNYQQVQNANQGGQFATVGQTNQTQNGVTGQTTNQNQNTTDAQATNQNQSQNTNNQQNTNQSTANQQNTNQNTTTNENQVQNSNTTGTTTQDVNQNTTTNAIDTLGFGKLLQDQAASTGASDANRNAWLQDTMQTGGSGFNSQVEQAIHNSLTGSQMTGAGDSARARAAGYGAAQVARNNLDERLNAASQLAGPTGLTTLSSAANPYIGSSANTTGKNTTFQDLVTKGTTASTGGQNTTGSTTGLQTTLGNTSGSTGMTGNTNGTSASTQNQNTSGNTTGFSDLTTKGSESQAGVTAGQSSQAGAGVIPQGQQVSSGGCVLCTAAIEMKLPKANMLRVLRRVINHKLNVDRSAYANASRGYFAVFTPFARWLLVHPRLATFLFPLARATVYEELRISGRQLPWKLVPWGVHGCGHVVCEAVGRFFPVPQGVTDPVITDIARRNNILFEVKS